MTEMVNALTLKATTAELCRESASDMLLGTGNATILAVVSSFWLAPNMLPGAVRVGERGVHLLAVRI